MRSPWGSGDVARAGLARLGTLSTIATLALMGAGCGSSSSSPGSGGAAGSAAGHGGGGMGTAGNGGTVGAGGGGASGGIGGGGGIGGAGGGLGGAAGGPAPAADAPSFTPPGGTFTTAQSVTITATTPDATIFYTLDGTIPTAQSTKFTAPINISQTTTIVAFAQAPMFQDSAIALATFMIAVPQGVVAPVSFSSPAGTFDNDLSVSLSTTTTGATICYTTDGTTPTCLAGTCGSGAVTYLPSAPVAISGATTDQTTGSRTINAIACLAGSTPTAVTTQRYTLQVATPLFTQPAPGIFPVRALPYSPAASTTTVGAQAMFSLDPTNPPSCSEGSPLVLPGSVSLISNQGNRQVLMVGCKAGYLPSSVAVGNYEFQLNAPAFSPTIGATLHANTVITVDDSANSPATTNDWVCATTDGTPPGCTTAGCTSGTDHSGPLHQGDAIASVNVTGSVLNAIACSSTAPSFVASSVVNSGAYTLQLDPIRFSSPTGTAIPVPPKSLSITLSQNNPGADEPYDFLCYTTNGTTAPDCACGSVGQTKVSGTSSPALILTGTNAITIRAVGCSSSGNVDRYLPSPEATASYPSAGSAAAPTVLPADTVRNNDTQIQFLNSDPTATVEVCYTTNGAPPGCIGTCTASAPPGATVDGPLLTAAATVRAVSCDVSLTKSPSAEVTPAPAYTFQAGHVALSPPPGAINVGGPITFTTVTKNAVIHYATGGIVATCTSPAIAVSGVDPGPYTATYSVTGLEAGGTISAVACRSNYTASTVSTASYVFTVATPGFKYGTGTYDDTLVEQVSVSPGIAGIWFCSSGGSATSCGSTAGTCATGVATATTTVAGVSSATFPITTSGASVNVIACAHPAGSTIASAGAAATYTLQTSGLRFIPTPGAVTGPANVAVNLQPAVTLPQGDGSAATGVTSSTEICVSTTQSPPPQPAPCAGFTSPAWTCATGGGVSGLGSGVSPSIAFADIGANTTFSAFTCRDGFVYQTSTASYTFTPYAHTIAMTGVAADFTAAAEQIATADAGAFAYVSWDATNLYVAFDKGVGFASSDYIHFYIGGASGGTQTTDTQKFLSPQSLPSNLKAAYHLWWKANGADTGMNAFASGNWGTTAAPPMVRFNPGSTLVEFSISRAAIGSPTDVHLVGGLWTGVESYGSWPLGAATPTTDVSWSNFQTELLGDAYLPNDPNRLNTP